MIALVALGFGLTGYAVQNEQSKADDGAHPAALVGDYYRGTATGEDHDLRLAADGTLQLVNGGCFRQDPPLVGRWRATKSSVLIAGSPELLRSLGKELKLRLDKRAILLVPVGLATKAKQNRYGTWYVFWPSAERERGLNVSWPRNGRTP